MPRVRAMRGQSTEHGVGGLAPELASGPGYAYGTWFGR
jgi:hypothetical protein